MNRWMIAAGVLVMAGAGGQAARAAEITRSITTKAGPDAVWSIVGGFADIATWLPGAASSPADKGNDVGSVRVITLSAAGNPTITERLTARDDTKHSYSYDIEKVDPAVLPVVHYHSTLTVAPLGRGTKVTWHGSFGAAAGSTTAAAVKAVDGIYRGGLAHVKSLADTQ